MVSAPPRIQLLPSGVVSSLGGQAADLVGNAGLVLDDWQRAVLHGGLGVRADDSWAADEVVLVCPRQNGKTALAAARLMLGLYRASRCSTRRIVSIRPGSCSRSSWRSCVLRRSSSRCSRALSSRSAREAIHLTNGARCLFGTRSTSRTGRGFSLDAIVLDEAHYVSEESLVALGFTGYARDRAPQRWYLSSAVDRDVHEHGLTMSRLRERAIRGEAASFAYFEWSAAVLDADGRELECGDVTPDQIDDEALWYQANPALGTRVPIERVRAERESLPHRGFLTERLGIGAWWPTVEAVDAPITAAEWAALEDSGSKRVGELVLAFDIDPDRRCALVACGRRGADELSTSSASGSASGTSWRRDELERLSDRYDVEAIVTDGYGGNLAMVRTLEDAGLRVRTLTGGEQASACAKLLDLVQGREFRHIGQPEPRARSVARR